MTDTGEGHQEASAGASSTSSAPPRRCWRFERFELDEAQEVLRAAGQVVALRAQAFEVLRLLVERAPAVVSRAEILRQVWHGSFVSEAALSQVISEIRRGLGDSATEPRFIATRYGKGYRLLVSVELVRGDALVSPARPVGEPRRRRAAVALAAALGVGVIAGLWWLGVLDRKTVVTPRVETTELAVVGFANATGDERHDWLTLGLVERLSDRLGAGSGVRVASLQDVARLRLERSLRRQEEPPTADLEPLRRRLAADYLITGRIESAEATDERGIVVRAWVHPPPPELGRTPAVSVRGEGSPADLDRLGRELAAGVERLLGLRGPAGAGDERVALAVPADESAAEALYQGLERLWLFDAQGALERLRFAESKDPTSPMIQWALARTWRRLGWDTRAREAASQAMAGAQEPFSERQRLLIEGLFHETGGELGEAIERYRALRALAPERLDYGLYLVDALILGGQPGDALETLAGLRPLAAGDVDLGHLELRAARAYSAASRLEDQSEAARRAEAAGRRLLSPHLVAEGLFEEAISWSRRSESQRARGLFDEAEERFEQVGDRAGVARCRIEKAREEANLGRHESAMVEAEEALELALETGERLTEGLALHTIGLIHFRQKRSQEALRRWQEAQTIFAEIGDRRRYAGTLKSIGAVRYDMGDLEGATRDLGRGIEAFRDMGARLELSSALSNLGLYRWEQGRRREARETWEEGMQVAEEVGDRRSVGILQINLGWAAEQEGRWADADRWLTRAEETLRPLGAERPLMNALCNRATAAHGLGELFVMASKALECRELADRLGDPRVEAAALNVLGALATEEGLRDRAERWFNDAAEVAKAAELAGSESEALLGLARVARLCGDWRQAEELIGEAERLAASTAARLERVFLLAAQGRLEEAEAALGEIELDGRSLSPALRFRLLLASVQVLVDQRRFDEALARLAEVDGWRQGAAWGVRARLEMAEGLAVAYTDSSREAEADLAILQAEAGAKGFVVAQLEARLAQAAAAALSDRSEVAAATREEALAQAASLGWNGLGGG